MIQNYFKDEAERTLPELEWSIDYYTSEDNTGTVYSEGGEPPDTYDASFRYPEYMFFIRSSDWAFAREAAYKVFGLFHNKNDLLIPVDENNYRVFLITAMSEPLRLGVLNNIMEYSINFQVTLREVTENG